MLGDGFADAATFGFASGTMLEVVVAFTALANAALFVLNMVPAFPLDGGRIARAIAWKLTGNRHGATRFAAYLGQGFAALMMGYGVYCRARRRTTGSAASGTSCSAGCSAARPARRSPRATSPPGWRASRRATSWTPSPSSSPPPTPVAQAYDEYFLRYQGWPWFAVVEEDGRFVGLAHRAAVEHAALHENSAVPVRDVVADGEQVQVDTPLESLIGSEPLRRLGALMAVDADGRLRGVVTLEQVSRALQARLAPS